RLLPHADGQGGQTDRSAAEAAAQGPQDGAVDLVEAALVDAEQGQSGPCRGEVDDAVGPDLGVVAHPPQQPVGDAGRSPAAAEIGPAPTPRARVDRPTGPPPKLRHRARRMARSTLSRPRSSTPNRASPARAVARSTMPSARTSA